MIIQGKKFFPIFFFNVSSNQINLDVHTLVIVLTAEIIDGKVKAGDDLVALYWIDKSTTLPEMVIESDIFIITKYFIYV